MTDIPPRPTTSARELRWSDTLARSGKLKGVSSVVNNIPAKHPPAAPSRKKYRVRFGPDSASKNRVQKPSPRSQRQRTVATGLLRPTQEPVPSSQTEPQLPNSAATEDHTLESIPAVQCLSTDEAFMSPWDENWLEDDTQANLAPVDAPSTSEDGHFPPMSALDVSPPSAFAMIQQSPAGNWRYLQFYVEKVAPRLAPLWQTSDNPFLSIALPLAMESSLLFHALLALSVSQLNVAAQHVGQPQLQALWHKNKAIELFRQHLAQGSAPTFACVITCIFMQTIEVLGSGTGNWSQWLTGAILMITSRNSLPQDIQTTDTWFTLTECVVAMDTFAALTSQHYPELSRQYWSTRWAVKHPPARPSNRLPPEAAIISNCADDLTFSRILGCPAAVLYALSQIAELLRIREQSQDLGSLLPDRLLALESTMSSVEDILLRWSPVTPDGGPSYPAHDHHLMESFRHAALVTFHRKIRHLPYTHRTVHGHVQETLQHLTRARMSEFSTISLWPLMVAGAEIDEEECGRLKEVVRARFAEIRHTQSDPLFQNAESFLDTVWEARGGAGSWEGRVAVEWEALALAQGLQWCFW
ncbi:fungal-specific transcription factor domain-containing protein [Aspergillus insuetus]